MTDTWSKRVLDDFGRKAATYNLGVPLQRAVAERLAEHIRRAAAPHGLWVDLGSGSGLLANAIVRRHPGQSVLRVDGSAAMLEQQPAGVKTLLQDLGHGLPVLTQPPQLLASSFCLHWLGDPVGQLQRWGAALAPGGVLALAVPVAGSFPQWHQAAGAAGVPCTALPFPDPDQLLEAVGSHTVLLDQRLPFTQHGAEPSALLRGFAAIGANATQLPPLGGGAMRRLLRAWPRDRSHQQVSLTWSLQLLLVRR